MPKGPRCENARFCADFRSVDARIDHLPECREDDAAEYQALVNLVEDLRYEGYIKSKKNTYQVDFEFDNELHVRLCSRGHGCTSGPVLNAPNEVARAVGLNADLLVRGINAARVLVVEIEKSNREKILRDIVKMLLFFDAGQADFAALVCPRNYVHTNNSQGLRP